MTKRLNITLPDEVLARADAFATSQRYTRSGLIAAALDAFVSGGAGTADFACETVTVAYAPEAVGLNPAIRPLVPAIIEACRKHGVVWAALLGSSTQPDPKIVPRDLDIMVDLGPGLEDRARRYFGLIQDLEAASDRSVDLIERRAERNEYLEAEFNRTQVVLYEAP
jgi:predicted nucleotidyltransferase